MNEREVMEVWQLIAKLKHCEPSAEVQVVSGYDGLYQPLAVITSGPIVVRLDVSDEKPVDTPDDNR